MRTNLNMAVGITIKYLIRRRCQIFQYFNFDARLRYINLSLEHNMQ